MVSLNTVAGKALVGVTSGTTAPATEGAREAARLFLFDVTHTVRWHVIAATAALAATPIVYQLSRVVAQRHRAELVNVAKDAVQREELFNDAEDDGVMIGPTGVGGITISYNTLTGARRQPPPQQQGRAEGGYGVATAAAAQDVADINGKDSSGEPSSSCSTSVSSILSMCAGRCHSCVISSFARQVLAAQRAPKALFVRTCSRAAACQYCVVVLRMCAMSCTLCVASLCVTHSCCTLLEKVIPIVHSSGSSSAMPTASASGDNGMHLSFIARNFFSAPLFDSAVPPSPSVGCIYGLYDFSTSASGVWSRLIPQLGVVQTLFQRFLCCLQPTHAEWRGNVALTRPLGVAARASSSAADARADAVWAALTPRGYFVVTLLIQLPWRVLSGLLWAGGAASDAVMRCWYGAASTPAASAAASSPPLHNKPPNPQRQAPPPKPRQRRKLFHAPLVKLAALIAGDVVFSGVVFAATLFASNSSRGPQPLVRNAAGIRYNAFCWVDAASKVAFLAALWRQR
ncbi:hypothetical protein ABL78_1241 [Leptomonas seymouri]|uniref:Uncharacterized protein n=1 Tax=Leptomonas seymouri TaxID=5684 RepID=A0A0N1I976_LEPSE|nr:hypothetical protein ABL78_1241 [Leptomonas seymouri]|eukprot:KPI89660.1 hypothetical protein ABL78_1241 [Leptomonas seymouri]